MIGAVGLVSAAVPVGKKIARRTVSGSAVPHRPHKCSRRDKTRAVQPVDVER
jgi:hypothetical protein